MDQPPSVGWGEFEITGPGDVDTGDWMGWLRVSRAPYIWSYTLNGWLYMTEPPADAPGAWAYIYK